jgi:hypothetical protein
MTSAVTDAIHTQVLRATAPTVIDSTPPTVLPAPSRPGWVLTLVVVALALAVALTVLAVVTARTLPGSSAATSGIAAPMLIAWSR